jgi:thiosulfate/3-mercaptopyruvate sulfurtransferase
VSQYPSEEEGENKMTVSGGGRALAVVAVAPALIAGLVFHAQNQRSTSHAAQGHDPWTNGEVMTPEALVKELSRSVPDRPAVVYVGFDFLYQSAHIPGAVFEGPAREAKGIEALTKWARDVPRDKEVVLYCGCCPWTDCPNIRPAFRALRSLGFKRLKVVKMDNDFARDWVAKGYPVEKGK